jgi:predicted dehydrogenase
MSARPAAAIVGAGFVGAQHVDALRRIGVEVRLLASSSAERAESAARALGIARSSGDWESVVTDPAIDVVHVCVPNDLHRPVVLAALGAGKHVVCEKPLALTVAEGRELQAAAERSGRVAVLCHNYRFFAMVAELRLRATAGALGELHALRGHYLQDWLLAPDATNWRIDTARGGQSRVLADIGTHWIDLAEQVSGRRLEAVIAQLSTLHGTRPDYRHVATFGGGTGDGNSIPVTTEDQASLLLRFQGGLHGAVWLSQVSAGHRNDLELAVDGSDGSATWRQEQPDELLIGRSEEVHGITRSPSGLAPGARSLARLPAGHNEGWADALRNLVAAAYAEIEGGRDEASKRAAPLPTFEDGVRHLAFVEAALRSAADGRWASVADVSQAQAAKEVR